MLLLTIALSLWPCLFFAGNALLSALDGIDSALLALFTLLYAVPSAILHRNYFRRAKTLSIPLQKKAGYNLLLQLVLTISDAVLYGRILFQYIETRSAIANGAMMCVPMFLFYFILYIPYNLSRIFALFATLGTSKYLLEEYYWKTEQNTLHRNVWLHVVMHLLPIVHIVSNILVYCKVKQLPNEPAEP